MKKFIIENKSLVLLWVLCGIALFIFCGHYGNILLDIGREIYYPEKILEGKVLYKDLFNIYGPFAYLYNALLYKIFSPNLGTLYFSGILCSFGIVSGIYLIARKFLSDFLSVAIAAFTIMTGVCATHLFNFTLPYSWAMLYGTVGFIYSVWALIKYKKENKLEYLYLASLLGGFCVSNKYDFFVYGLLLFIIIFLTKNKRAILSSFTCFLFFPVICALTLFFQGLRLHDMLTAIETIKDMISSAALNRFYTVQGIYYHPKILILWLINILKTGFGFLGLIGGYKLIEKNKIIGYTVCTIFTALIGFFTTPVVFMFLVPLLIITTVANCMKLKNNIPIILLVFCALSVCAKCFWVLHPLNYGNYFISIIITAFLAVVFTFLDKKYEKIIAIGLLAVGVHFLCNSLYNRLYLNGKVSTQKGTIYTYEKNAQTTDSLIIGLEQNKAKSALIFPEGLIVNFLANVEADGYYNSMLPLYTETFGEKDFINRVISDDIEYVVFNNLSMKEYGYEHICDDYAQHFCSYIINNYTQIEDINDGFRYIVFQKHK